MKAMVLAAGFGTRLGALGKTTAKCLVSVGGASLLAHVARQLKRTGVTTAVINLHHLAEQVRQALQQEDFGIAWEFSVEEKILGTGGGIKRAKKLLAGEEFFILHNGDVYSEIDLKLVVERHKKSNALATLIVRASPGSRPLLFDQAGLLVGWRSKEQGADRLLPGAVTAKAYGFCGISIISTKIFNYLEKQGDVFSIIESLMIAAENDEKIEAYVGSDYWVDAGTPERLAELEKHLKLAKE